MNGRINKYYWRTSYCAERSSKEFPLKSSTRINRYKTKVSTCWIDIEFSVFSNRYFRRESRGRTTFRVTFKRNFPELEKNILLN